MTMLDLPTKKSIQQSATAGLHLNARPTQCVIIAAINEDPCWETPLLTPSMILISSDGKYMPPLPSSLHQEKAGLP